MMVGLIKIWKLFIHLFRERNSINCIFFNLTRKIILKLKLSDYYVEFFIFLWDIKTFLIEIKSKKVKKEHLLFLLLFFYYYKLW